MSKFIYFFKFPPYIKSLFCTQLWMTVKKYKINFKIISVERTPQEKQDSTLICDPIVRGIEYMKTDSPRINSGTRIMTKMMFGTIKLKNHPPE